MSPVKKLGLVSVLIVVVAIIITVFILGQPTQTQQNALEISNLNSGGSITVTVNNDGTMGPASWYGNFSNSLSANQTGTLTFSVTDPVVTITPSSSGEITRSVTCTPRPACLDANPPCKLAVTSNMCPPTPTLVPGNQNNNGKRPSEVPTRHSYGPKIVTALVIDITKVEVHMAYLGIPGGHGQTGSPQTTPTPVDHWETLNITSPVTVDLVKLAANGGGIAALGLTKLAAGEYTEVRLYLSSANATLFNGTTVNLTILGKDNIVRVVQPFVIVSGQNTSLTMDFDAQHSVVYDGTNYLFKPVVARLLESR